MMIKCLHLYFEPLKQEVLKQLDTSHILPSDCKKLSTEIYKKTRKRISETTLKRIYGFAYAPFKPSIFTINTIAEFCGYSGWDDFCKMQSSISSVTHLKEDQQWAKTVENASQITNATLQALKNRSGIPYNFTINRNFINEHLTAFLAGDYTATFFSAPSGYGKTIALCHWIEKQMELNHTRSSKDIILFFSGSALMTSSIGGIDIKAWMMALLGMDIKNRIEDMFQQMLGSDGRFYLIIDGLDEFYCKGNQFDNVFLQLADIVSLYKQDRRFKVVITMRSSTWINSQHMVMDSGKWFPGFMFDAQNAINVPLLNNEEILRLNNNLSTIKSEKLGSNILEGLSNPLFFQYFYKAKIITFAINDFNQLNVFEIISAYTLNKIYKSRYSVDIILFLRSFIKEIDFKSTRYAVSKLKIVELIKKYTHAYEELVSIGYLQNVNTSYGSEFLNNVSFSNDKLMEHSLSKKLLYDNGERFDHQLLSAINDLSSKTQIKLNVLKWCIFQTFSAGRPFDFTVLTDFSITISEKLDLILFVGQLLNKKLMNAEFLETTNINFAVNTFDYFIGLEFANGSYEQALNTVLKFNLSLTEELLFKCSLCIMAIIKLDIPVLEARYNELRQYHSDSFRDFPINPLTCLDTIYYYLKYGVVKSEAFTELTKFCFVPPMFAYNKEATSLNEVTYLLALHTLSICQNPRKTLRFINVVNRLYPNGSAGYIFLVKIIIAEALLALGKNKDALTIFSDLAAIYPHEEAGYTAMMKVYYHSLRIKLTLYHNQNTAVLDEIKSLVKLCDDSSFKLVKVSSLAFVLSRYPALKEDDNRIFNLFYFDFIKTARTSGCGTEMFMHIPD